MKLYLISQTNVDDYDTYDSAVVVAESEEDARRVHPSPFVTHTNKGVWMGTYTKGGEYETGSHDWPSLSDIECVEVEFLGETNRPRGVILGSFNAG